MVKLFLICPFNLGWAFLGVALGSYVYGKVLVASSDSSLSLHSRLGAGLAVCVSMARGFRRAELFLNRPGNKKFPVWVRHLIALAAFILSLALTLLVITTFRLNIRCVDSIITPY